MPKRTILVSRCLLKLPVQIDMIAHDNPSIGCRRHRANDGPFRLGRPVLRAPVFLLNPLKQEESLPLPAGIQTTRHRLHRGHLASNNAAV
jgi:hypothetical protein